MNQITVIKDSLLDAPFSVFSDEPQSFESAPQCKVSIGELEVGSRETKALTRVEIWELTDPDDEKLQAAIDKVLDHLRDDVGALPVTGLPVAEREVGGAKWSGYAVNVRLR